MNGTGDIRIVLWALGKPQHGEEKKRSPKKSLQVV